MTKLALIKSPPKDKTFLETLRQLMASKDLWVELKPDQPSRMVLKGTYGEKIHKAFRMTRQGVRWRFWRLFNDIYVSAFETILFAEKAFGTELREHAIRISKERHALRQEAVGTGFQGADTLVRAPEEEKVDVSRGLKEQEGAANVSDEKTVPGER